jgi:hypothetical protein
LIENNPTRTGILFQREYHQKVNVTDTDTSPDGLTLACAPSFIYPRVVGKELLVIFVLAESVVRRDETPADGILVWRVMVVYIIREQPSGKL